jgi:hypothetical protein
MAFDPFAEPQLKIDWAKHHIANLNGEINSFMSERPFVLRVVQHPEIAQRQYLIEAKKPIPNKFALMIGDAIHNLRSALDIMMVGLVSPFTGSPEGIQFPFCKSADRMNGAITGPQIHLAGPKIRLAIEALQPYPGGDEKFYGLHELDICDKHRLIVPIGRNAELTDADFKKMEPGLLAGVQPKGNRIILAGGGSTKEPIVFRINITNVATADIQRINMPAEIQPTFAICFDEGQPFASEAVIPTLGLLTRKVEYAVASIKKAAT